MKQHKRHKNSEKSGILILLLLVITVISVCVTVWALFFRESGAVLAPDYVPEKEANAETLQGDTGAKLESPEGGGSVTLTYSNHVTIDLSDESASLIFANPGKSNQDMMIQIVVQDTVFVQSGILNPGYQITTLDLPDGAVRKLSPGGYDGKFVVQYYNPETGEKAILNTEIPITITVVE